ncbi:MAG TPA: hypothetical protein VNM90_14840 [Haliangium sp.]|nr:hypothetical protein [Haliangium sp.]
MGKATGNELVLGGLCMSRQEWDEMDEPSRLELLQVLIDTSPPHVDDHAYESYQLVIAPVAASSAA